MFSPLRARADARVAGYRGRRTRSHPGADGLGQDARRVSPRDRPAERDARRGAPTPLLSPLKALNYDIERTSAARSRGSTQAVRWRAHRRHVCSRAAPDGASSGHPDHDPGVALPASDLSGARDAARHRNGDPRRGARRRGHEARLSSCVVARAPRTTGRAPFQRVGLSATQRPLEEIGRFVAGSGARSSSSTRHPQGARPRGRRSGRGHARARLECERLGAAAADGVSGPRRRAVRPLDLAFDLPRNSRPRASITARRSSSSTTAAWPSASPRGSTSWPGRSSRGLTTGRSHASNGSSSRSC